MSTFAWVRLRSSLNLQAHVSSNLLLLTLTYLEETQSPVGNIGKQWLLNAVRRMARHKESIRCFPIGVITSEGCLIVPWSVCIEREDRALLREAKQEDTQIPYFRQDRTMVEWRSLHVSTERWVWKHKQPSSCWVLRPCFKARAESQRQQMALARS